MRNISSAIAYHRKKFKFHRAELIRTEKLADHYLIESRNTFLLSQHPVSKDKQQNLEEESRWRAIMSRKYVEAAKYHLIEAKFHDCQMENLMYESRSKDPDSNADKRHTRHKSDGEELDYIPLNRKSSSNYSLPGNRIPLTLSIENLTRTFGMLDFEKDSKIAFCKRWKDDEPLVKLRNSYSFDNEKRKKDSLENLWYLFDRGHHYDPHSEPLAKNNNNDNKSYKNKNNYNSKVSSFITTNSDAQVNGLVEKLLHRRRSYHSNSNDILAPTFVHNITKKPSYLQGDNSTYVYKNLFNKYEKADYPLLHKTESYSNLTRKKSNRYLRSFHNDINLNSEPKDYWKCYKDSLLVDKQSQQILEHISRHGSPQNYSHGFHQQFYPSNEQKFTQQTSLQHSNFVPRSNSQNKLNLGINKYKRHEETRTTKYPVENSHSSHWPDVLPAHDPAKSSFQYKSKRATTPTQKKFNFDSFENIWTVENSFDRWVERNANRRSGSLSVDKRLNAGMTTLNAGLTTLNNNSRSNSHDDGQPTNDRYHAESSKRYTCSGGCCRRVNGNSCSNNNEGAALDCPTMDACYFECPMCDRCSLYCCRDEGKPVEVANDDSQHLRIDKEEAVKLRKVDQIVGEMISLVAEDEGKTENKKIGKNVKQAKSEKMNKKSKNRVNMNDLK